MRSPVGHDGALAEHINASKQRNLARCRTECPHDQSELTANGHMLDLPQFHIEETLLMLAPSLEHQILELDEFPGEVRG